MKFNANFFLLILNLFGISFVNPIEMMKDNIENNNASLVADALANGPESFEPIIERYKNAVFSVALVRLRNFHDAEDFTQDAFLEAYQRLSTLKDPERLGAWLRSIVIHRCINYLNRKGNAKEVEHTYHNNRLTPQDFIDRQILHEQVFQAIDRLGKTQRETVILFYISGYTQQEIAAIQEVPLGTIKSRLHEAKKRLKEDMLEMVEDILKNEGPKEDFSERVFDLLFEPSDERKMWRDDIRKELEEIGKPGMQGFARALNLPQWQTRRTALFYIGTMPQSDEKTALLKEALGDKNRNVRKYAASALLGVLNKTGGQQCDTFIPLIAQTLFDPSIRVRRFMTCPWIWGQWASHIPLTTLAKALVKEQDPVIRERMNELLIMVLENQTS